jgi:hypothetical protein
MGQTCGQDARASGMSARCVDTYAFKRQYRKTLLLHDKPPSLSEKHFNKPAWGIRSEVS